MFRKHIFDRKYFRMNCTNNLTWLELKFVGIFFSWLFPLVKKFPTLRHPRRELICVRVSVRQRNHRTTFYKLIKLVKLDSRRHFPFPPLAVAGANVHYMACQSDSTHGVFNVQIKRESCCSFSLLSPLLTSRYSKFRNSGPMLVVYLWNQPALRLHNSLHESTVSLKTY
jgi:hypothetical protein